MIITVDMRKNCIKEFRLLGPAEDLNYGEGTIIKSSIDFDKVFRYYLEKRGEGTFRKYKRPIVNINCGEDNGGIAVFESSGNESENDKGMDFRVYNGEIIEEN